MSDELVAGKPPGPNWARWRALRGNASLEAYCRELRARLRAILAGDLLGIYLGGSIALQDFDPERSDVDVVAVSRHRLLEGQKRQIVQALRHEALPVPARGLEFVVYREHVVRIPTNEAAFELNLDTGRAIGFRADFAPGTIERHWFPLDRALIASAGIAIDGPPAGELFSPMPRDLLLPVIRESLTWHGRDELSEDADVC